MWGFDDKDFKGYITGSRPKRYLDDTTASKTVVHNLYPSDNHQRANALVWCLYKSILPPPCNLESQKVASWTGGSEKWYPLRFLCANGKNYSDFYRSDNHARIYYYYTKIDEDGKIVPDTDGDSFYQAMFTDPDDGKVKYVFLKSTYNGVDCKDDGTTLKVTYLANEHDDSGMSICVDEKTIELPENGASLMPYDRLRFKDLDFPCFANDALYGDKTSLNACLAFYSMEDIDNADPDISQRMKVSNFLYYMRNNCTDVNSGRTRWNYYVTIQDDDPDYIYLWSDRETCGGTYGTGTTYECSDGTKAHLPVVNGGNTLETQSIGKGWDNENWKEYDYRVPTVVISPDFNHFFKGALALIPSDENLEWLKANFTVTKTTYSYYNVRNDQWGHVSNYDRRVTSTVQCWPTQFDGGGDDAPPTGWKGGGFYPSSTEAFDPSNADEAVYKQWRECVLQDDHFSGDCGNSKVSSCGLCGFAGNINFFTWSLWEYGQPGAIPTEVLTHKPNGDYGNFYDSPPNHIVSTSAQFDENYTNFATKQGSLIANNGRYNLKNDTPILPGWDHAYHCVNIKFDPIAFEAYMDKLIQDISRQEVTHRDPVEAHAQTIDELKEEADNADKHYWCVDRDTVFIYDNTITKMEIKPNFIVCDDKAQLIGENPGVAAEANASGYWTIKTNTQSVKFDTDAESTNNVANVHGLPAGETQFNWHITRWECEFDKDMFVYYNAVESNPGAEIYTCDDKAQLEAVQPSVGEGHWEFTQATPPGVQYGDDGTGPATDQDAAKKNNKAWVHYLQQGDNPFTWVVENPMPPSKTETRIDDQGNVLTYEVLEEINGHKYYIQESCPVGKETKVHDLRPDDAVIETGDNVGP
jgi:hypothetical protein